MTVMVYKGNRLLNRRCAVQVWFGSEREPLPLRLDLRSHSPDGFEWGYFGSGPAQLALAMLAHAVEDDDQVVVLYQWFKAEVIARIKRDQWEISHSKVWEWYLSQLTQRTRAEEEERRRNHGW